MLKIFLKAGLLTVFALINISARTWYYFHDDKYQKIVSARTTYLAIKKSKEVKKVKKLVMGDSVAYQLFPEPKFNGPINSIASVQGVSFAGFYFLLKNFLEANAQDLPEEVDIIFHPSCLSNNLDQSYTYNDFLKPFYCAPYKELYSQTVTRQIQKIPYYYLSQFPPVKMSNWSPPLLRGHGLEIDPFSPISVEYLSKIKGMCDSFHVKLNLLPPPINSDLRSTVEESMQAIAKNAGQCGLESQFADYLRNIHYLDPSLYKDDRHLRKPETITAEYIASGKI